MQNKSKNVFDWKFMRDFSGVLNLFNLKSSTSKESRKINIWSLNIKKLMKYFTWFSEICWETLIFLLMIANLEAKHSTKQPKFYFSPLKLPLNEWIKGFDFDLSCLTIKRHCYRKSHGKAVLNRFCRRNINIIRYWT